ncbi:MAG TPA: YetF domain-containing protein [Pseudorhizobium sp.]|nr:YetF domain-containing protein [Pseudorhizobium sp.]
MDWSELFFQGWENVVRTLVVGVLAYVVLILFIRISGKRTLAKLNAFDLVVTVALGSTLASILLQKSIALTEGAVALGLLIGLQYLVTFLSVRSHGFAKIIRSQPTLLARKGQFCSGALLHQRLTEDEVLSAVRSQGLDGLEQAEAVILESDGSVSVIRKSG